MSVKGSASARGYDSQHQKLRRHWQAIVDAGMATCSAAQCLQVSRYIRPGTPWDLDHTDDRTAYRGPSHRACNRAAGARKRNAQARRRPYRVY